MTMILTHLLCLAAGAAPFVVYTPNVEVSASSHAGDTYAPTRAVDLGAGTRWASADARLPQWFEARFPAPASIDTVSVDIAVDTLYAAWREVEVSFSEGDPIRFALDESERIVRWRIPPRMTDRVRITILSVHEPKHYVGIRELTLAYDPESQLEPATAPPQPLALADLEIRGRADHPCVNITRDDVARALERIRDHAWARRIRDEIVKEADEWLRESDGYWLSYLPEPGACYAYGFTGCPITNRTMGTWVGARCRWDKPRQVMNPEGRWLPDDEHPDAGQGYTAPDGRIHYFVGMFNAWATEQWTLNALPALSQAYLLTDDERYAERGALFLDALASIYSESTSGSWDYPSNPPSGRLARPWYQVARNLVKYVDYYDFLYHSPAMDEPSLRPGLSRRENIERHMLLDGAYYCYEHSYHGALHNGHADYLRGALAVGCAMDIPEFVRNAVESTFSIHTMLSNNIDRDGRYYETAILYALHARNLYLTFADPLYNLRNAEYPQGINLYDDPRMQSTLFLPESVLDVCGRTPNFGDTAPDYAYKPPPTQPFSALDYRYLERLYARAGDPGLRSVYGGALAYLAGGDVDRLRYTDGDAWLLWKGAEAPSEPPALPDTMAYRTHASWVAGMKGMVFLRGGGQAAFLRYGPSLNHGDFDDLALLFYANGYQLSYDIGYGLGSTHCQVGWASRTVSHCLVTVDESDQLKGHGSGGSLLFFGDLPSVKVVEATSELSYSASDVSEYRRTVALLTEGRYLIDFFRVTGGRSHDYGFGSLGTDLTPFGVTELAPREGSLAEGVAWGDKVGMDGDIVGYPNKPYWNPPPGNGYGFFYNVRGGGADAVWGGDWRISGTVPTRLRMHFAGDPAEPVFADAPGLTPSLPNASYVLARRRSEDGAPLRSTFIAVYEPFDTPGLAYAMDYRALTRNLVESSHEVTGIDSPGIALLKADRAGGFMTCRVTTDETTRLPLRVYCVQGPSYGVLEVEWDGRRVGESMNLESEARFGPVALEIDDIPVDPGEHTITFRAGESNAFLIPVAGLAFGPPPATGACAPILDGVRRLAANAVEVRRLDGAVDVIVSGACDTDSPYGRIAFEGEFALITGDGKRLERAELVGCSGLTVDGHSLDYGPAAFEATVIDVDLETRSVLLDTAVPIGMERLVAVFSNPAYTRTSAYHVLGADGNRLVLQAGTLSLGKGRVQTILGPTALHSDLTHEYARAVSRASNTRFFDGKTLVGEHGGVTRALKVNAGAPLHLEVEDATVFQPGEHFDYLDLAPGDRVRVSLSRICERSLRL